MATILIDKLLQACVKQGASDIHIVVGQPPVFRLHGPLRLCTEFRRPLARSQSPTAQMW